MVTVATRLLTAEQCYEWAYRREIGCRLVWVLDPGFPLSCRGSLRPARTAAMSHPTRTQGAALEELHARLGYRRLSRTWAKLELLLGLAAAGGGLLVSVWGVTRSEGVQVEWSAGGWALFVLGGYLLLAGHRSHLYQSQNEQTACLLQAIHEMSEKGASE